MNTDMKFCQQQSEKIMPDIEVIDLSHCGHYQRQTGNILVVFTIALFALIALAALALDGNHMLLHKTRLQNIVDAAALHAAKELDLGVSRSDARQAAIEMIDANLNHPDNHELRSAITTNITDYGIAQLTSQIWVDFYQTPEIDNSTPSTNGEYVRIRVSNVSLSNFLAQVMSFNKQVSATAQAGPSTRLIECYYDLVPMLVCAPEPNDFNHNDGDFFGLPINNESSPPTGGGLYVMKAGAGTESIGPGNFQLIRLNDAQGGADIRDAMAGASNSNVPTCFAPPDPATSTPGEGIPTEPGNTVGPLSQGLNTRFGKYNGPVNDADFPSDKNTCEGQVMTISEHTNEQDQNYFTIDTDTNNAYRYYHYIRDSYDESLSASCTVPIHTDGTTEETRVNVADGRRVLSVVVGDCTNQTNGSSSIPYLGSGCFFLTQSVQSGGQESYVVGEFLKECGALGLPSGIAEDGIGPYTIVLYRVPGSTDS
ncbi:pilus assembly protein TadG-related protein [Thalassotalea aquiviva]|uniref:pilus assembly protein TadG-related protein n=1 Tax=Thalassotalea aquiviva TaxID=3242415 RepID=UPI00352A55DB